MGKWVLTGFDNDKKGERFCGGIVRCEVKAGWRKVHTKKEHNVMKQQCTLAWPAGIADVQGDASYAESPVQAEHMCCAADQGSVWLYLTLTSYIRGTLLPGSYKALSWLANFTKTHHVLNHVNNMLSFAELDWLVPPLQARLKSAVESEQQHEAKLLNQLYASGSLRRLQKDGLVLLRLQALPHSVLYSSMVWKFTVGGGSASRQQQNQKQGGQLPYHRFRQGDSLLITRFSEGQEQREGAGSSSSSSSSSAGVWPRGEAGGMHPLDATVLEVGELLLSLLDQQENIYDIYIAVGQDANDMPT
jgi:hypothetical protein